MLLEKIRQHSGKISFFVINMLLVAIGVLFMRNKDLAKNQNPVSQTNIENEDSQQSSIDQEQQTSAAQSAIEETPNVPSQINTPPKQSATPPAPTVNAKPKAVSKPSKTTRTS